MTMIVTVTFSMTVTDLLDDSDNECDLLDDSDNDVLDGSKSYFLDDSDSHFFHDSKRDFLDDSDSDILDDSDSDADSDILPDESYTKHVHSLYEASTFHQLYYLKPVQFNRI